MRMMRQTSILREMRLARYKVASIFSKTGLPNDNPTMKSGENVF